MPRILIVDDHPFIRRGIQSILKAFPEWELCGEAENGADAIKLAKDTHPEVVIMDISMPGIGGIDATRAIHQMDPSAKIILLTLHDSPDLVRNAFRAGASGFLLKVDAERELMKALAIVVADGSYISPRVPTDVVNAVTHELKRPRRARTA